MEFEEQEEEETGLGPSYDDSPGNSNSTRSKPTPSCFPKSKYKECLKNHAVGIGGHAVDGCGEFIPAGEDGTVESLKCAACNCHRSFHRKEQLGLAYRGPLHVGPQPLLALPSTSTGTGSELEEYYGNMGGRKRFRTKFTQDQKEKMVKVAGRLGWRIQKQDEGMVEEFCREMGIKRQVLKVWMHNNKHNKTLQINNNNPPLPN